MKNLLNNFLITGRSACLLGSFLMSTLVSTVSFADTKDAHLEASAYIRYSFGANKAAPLAYGLQADYVNNKEYS